MTAPTTFQDLPDDMLHEIFERVIVDEPGKRSWPALQTWVPPSGAHLALRCVCRRWRDIADWVRLSTSSIVVGPELLADAGAVRARHPSAFKKLMLMQSRDRHSTGASRAAAGLINSSADLRRALHELILNICCLPALLPAVAPIASCTALTSLSLFWRAHENESAVPSSMLAPLSALRRLQALMYVLSPEYKAYELMPTSALLAPLPALPDAPRLTYLGLRLMGNFVPVGSDAALGRLRRLDFQHTAPVQDLVDAEDPFLLRAAFDAGTWQPSRLTGLQELEVVFGPVRGDVRAPALPSPTGFPSGSEWAPLAGQVTELIVRVGSGGYRRPSTGIVAGLGALTALRALRIEADFDRLAEPVDPGFLDLVSIDRVRAPHLTFLESHCVSSTVSVARFPNLEYLALMSITHQPPLNLRSLVARSTLTLLVLGNVLPGLINLAELFVGGHGWPVLKDLVLTNIMLEWDATGLAGAPTAAEFAQRARQLLPALFRVKIEEPHGPNALPDRSRVGFVVACRRHVVPALLGLHTGRD